MKAFAKITSNGSALSGFRSVAEMGGEDLSDYIELLSFAIGADRTVSSSGQVSGHPEYRRLTLNKRLDAASPMLLVALARGHTVEVELKMFGTSGASAGTVDLLFELGVKDGRVSGVDWDGTSGSDYGEETVQLAYGSLTANNHAGTMTSAEVTTAATS